jgi:hypothetical protein
MSRREEVVILYKQSETIRNIVPVKLLDPVNFRVKR